MTPMQAIVASTTVPAELLRRPDLGALAPGMLADVVAVRGDPLADIDSLADPAHIRLVIKDGRVAHDFRGRTARGSVLVGIVAERCLVGRDPPGGLLAEQAAVSERGEIRRVERQAGVETGDQEVERAPAREHPAGRHPDDRPPSSSAIQ